MAPLPTQRSVFSIAIVVLLLDRQPHEPSASAPCSLSRLLRRLPLPTEPTSAAPFKQPRLSGSRAPIPGLILLENRLKDSLLTALYPSSLNPT